jgi:medium-chain acyl-[acyl-carrier-protein] hydrolase
MARRPGATLTMLAFPQAGGGCSTFAAHSQAMPDWLRLLTLNLPGRQARFSEAVRTDLDGLVTDLAGDCARREEPYLMFGYCSGVLLAYLVSCRLRDCGANLPRGLVVGSYAAPHLVSSPPIASLSSEELWQALVDHHAVLPQLAGRPEVRQLMEPVIKADLGLIAQYQHVPSAPLPIPITVIVGEHDGWAPARDVESWRPYSTSEIQVRHIRAGHWFMEEDPAAAARVLAAEAGSARV